MWQVVRCAARGAHGFRRDRQLRRGCLTCSSGLNGCAGHQQQNGGSHRRDHRTGCPRVTPGEIYTPSFAHVGVADGRCARQPTLQGHCFRAAGARPAVDRGRRAAGRHCPRPTNRRGRAAPCASSGKGANHNAASPGASALPARSGGTAPAPRASAACAEDIATASVPPAEEAIAGGARAGGAAPPGWLAACNPLAAPSWPASALVPPAAGCPPPELPASALAAGRLAACCPASLLESSG